MPGSSSNGSWLYIDDDAFEADYPVSAGLSWVLRDKIAHLIDSYGQYRVSWMGKAGLATQALVLDSSVPNGTTTYTATFPLTLWHSKGGTGVITRVWYRSLDVGESNVVTLNARYVWASEAVNSTNAFDLHSFTDTTTSNSGVLHEDISTTGVVPNGYVGPGRQTYSIEENSDDHTVAMHVARLELKFSDDSNDGGELIGVQVIEFPVWP